ncbi:MAG: DUF2163 domain-containing protein [Pseudomonadota bacterium]
MTAVSPELRAHLETGATTLCWCWHVVRQDGDVLGFTDHDRDLTFDGTLYEAASGFSSRDARQAVGLNVDNTDIEGALQSGRISEQDLADGVYDRATISLYRVNWAAPSQRVLLRVGTIGEVTRTEHGFRAEVRGLAAQLGQVQGRLYQRQCDAALGDEHCGVDLDGCTLRREGEIVSVLSATRFIAAFNGAQDIPNNWFSFGLMAWSSGVQSGRTVQVRSHTFADGVHTLDVWEPMRGLVEAGDTFVATAGCDKAIATCRDKFANALNFRGFPHLPSAAYVTFYPSADDRRANA